MMLQLPLKDTLHTRSGENAAPYDGASDAAPALEKSAVLQASPLPDGISDGLMSDLIFKLTVNQFCSVIRQHGIEQEAATMLGMLESLVIAGEIPLADFMERVQNLLPHIFSRIDRQLLAKLTQAAAD